MSDDAPSLAETTFAYSCANPLMWLLHPYNLRPRGDGMLLEPFYQVQHVIKTDEQIATISADSGQSEEVIRKVLDESYKMPLFHNGLYQVELRTDFTSETAPRLVHLSIKRIDKDSIHDWRHLQEIKSRIVGPEFEGVELYPAEDRVVDTANQYHVWIVYEADFRWPFGFHDGRVVRYDSGGGAKQRPLG